MNQEWGLRRFWQDWGGDLWRLKLPKIVRHEEKPTWWDKRIPYALAAFGDDNCIQCLPEASRFTLAHEYGHWVIWRIREWFDAAWEFPWWGLGLRMLLGRRPPSPERTR